MSSYINGPTDYIPTILSYSLDNKLSVDIKTNAGFMKNANIRNYIINDIDTTAKKYHSASKPPPFSISLSLDKFHPNALENNYNFIMRLAKKQTPVTIQLSGFKSTEYMYYDLLNKLCDNLPMARATLLSQPDMELYQVNGCILLNYGNADLHSGGRANNLNNTRPPSPFEVITSDGILLIAFDNSGNVTLGPNNGKNITTPWCDKNGKGIPLSKIRKNLVTAASTKFNEVLPTFKQRIFNMFAKNK